MIGGMIRIEPHKVIPFLLFAVVITAFLFLPYFSRVELPPAQGSPFGSETVRTLVGSLGRNAAVPLTMAIAAGFALYSPRLGKWEQFLGAALSESKGPVGSEEGHSHKH